MPIYPILLSRVRKVPAYLRVGIARYLLYFAASDVCDEGQVVGCRFEAPVSAFLYESHSIFAAPRFFFCHKQEGLHTNSMAGQAMGSSNHL